VKLNNNWEGNWRPKLRLEFFPSSKAKSEFEYYTGSAVRAIAAQMERDGLKIEFGDLGTPGTIEVYCRKVTAVTLNGVKLHEGSEYRYEQQASRLTVSFQGASKIVIDGAASLF